MTDVMLWELLQPQTPPPPPCDATSWPDELDDLDGCFPTFHTTETAADAAPKCGYRTGKCHLKRGLKRNGSYHKLCDMHREKANWNQKKLDRKKRLRKDTQGPPKRVALAVPLAPSELDGTESRRPLTMTQHSHWAAEELAFFCQVMTPPSSPQTITDQPHPTAAMGWGSTDTPSICREGPGEDDDGAALDLLFKAEVMVLVDRWAP